MSRKYRNNERIARVEFNKVLASRCGFECKRSRVHCVQRYHPRPIHIFIILANLKRLYPRAAGNWLFHGRRWLNPHDPADRALLDSNYTALARAFPPFAASCDRPRFLEILADVAAKWASTLHGHGSAEHIIRWATGPRRRARPAVPSRPAGP